ncbi:hypothetical protein FNJ21_004301, partial [Vibrio fluvialis]|nr:hypothetical protein [Vibrio fluvialis]
LIYINELLENNEKKETENHMLNSKLESEVSELKLKLEELKIKNNDYSQKLIELEKYENDLALKIIELAPWCDSVISFTRWMKDSYIIKLRRLMHMMLNKKIIKGCTMRLIVWINKFRNKH